MDKNKKATLFLASQGITLFGSSIVLISVLRSVGTGIQTPAVNAAPAVAGAILSWKTIRFSLFIDIVTAIVGIAVLTAVSIPFEKKEDSPSALAEMKEGISYAVKERFIGKMLLVFGAFIFLCVPAGFLDTLFVTRYCGETYWYMTLVEVIGFLGMTAGGVLIGAWGGFKNRMKTLVVGMTAFGVLAIGMGVVDNFVIYLVLIAIYGIALTMVQTACTTVFQEHSSPEMMGRVFGLFGAMFSGFLPLGMAVFGPLADVVIQRYNLPRFARLYGLVAKKEKSE